MITGNSESAAQRAAITDAIYLLRHEDGGGRESWKIGSLLELFVDRYGTLSEETKYNPLHFPQMLAGRVKPPAARELLEQFGEKLSLLHKAVNDPDAVDWQESLNTRCWDVCEATNRLMTYMREHPKSGPKYGTVRDDELAEYLRPFDGNDTPRLAAKVLQARDEFSKVKASDGTERQIA